MHAFILCRIQSVKQMNIMLDNTDFCDILCLKKVIDGIRKSTDK